MGQGAWRVNAFDEAGGWGHAESFPVTEHLPSADQRPKLKTAGISAGLQFQMQGGEQEQPTPLPDYSRPPSRRAAAEDTFEMAHAPINPETHQEAKSHHGRSGAQGNIVLDEQPDELREALHHFLGES